MPLFNYRARNARGDLLNGALEGADSGTIAAYLMNTGVIPITIQQVADKDATGIRRWVEKLLSPPITSLDVQLFSRQMQTLLKAGIPMMQGLTSLAESATNKSFGNVLNSLRSALDTGRELSSAMRDHPAVFTPYYVSMIQVGEMTARLPEIFPRLYDYLQLDRQVREQIASALRYPKFVLFAIVAALGVVNSFVIPQFAKIFARANFELPTLTRAMLEMSSFTLANWPFLVAAVALGTFAFKRYTRTKEGRFLWDRIKMKIPIAGPLVMKGTMARFARSYALAEKSGVPVGQTLSVVAKTVDNAYIGMAVEQIRDGVERGETIFRTASTLGVFLPLVLQMIKVGEETSDMARLMDEVADMYERELEYDLKTLASRIEPIMIMFIGVLVLVMALGVFVPMWDMGQVQLHKPH